MRSSRKGAIPSELGWLVDELDSVQERLRTLETPSGESLNSTVSKLRDLVEDIQTTLNNFMAGRRTDAQIDAAIDAKVADGIATRLTQDQVDQRVYAIVGSILAGNVSIGGALNVQGTVTLPGARGTSLVSAPNRVNAWIAGDGRLGHTA